MLALALESTRESFGKPALSHFYSNLLSDVAFSGVQGLVWVELNATCGVCL